MRETRFNIVLMGMGEPLHNYDETMKALRILVDEHGFAMSPRRITLSTVGLLPAFERLAREPIMPNLAISLHAPNDALRDELVPLNRRYGVGDIIDVCETAQRAAPHNLLALPLPQVPGHFRIHKTGRDGVHGDAERSNFAGEGTCKTDNRRLCCTVNGEAVVSGGADNRRNVHNPPDSINHHGSHHVLG